MESQSEKGNILSKNINEKTNEKIMTNEGK